MDVDEFSRQPVMGILRGVRCEHVADLADVIKDAGLKTLEITMNTDQAPDLIKQFIEKAQGQFVVGAGTVLNIKDLEKALSAGATFIVSPVFVPEVVSRCVKENIPVFPGALTPQEIYAAWQAGVAMVKVFPSGHFGPKYFRDIKGPLQDIKLMACGGVRADNIKAFFDNGADAVAFGASIFKNEWLKNKQYDLIASSIRELILAGSLEK